MTGWSPPPRSARPPGRRGPPGPHCTRQRVTSPPAGARTWSTRSWTCPRSGAVHCPQKRKPSGFSAPHRAHTTIGEKYFLTVVHPRTRSRPAQGRRPDRATAGQGCSDRPFGREGLSPGRAAALPHRRPRGKGGQAAQTPSHRYEPRGPRDGRRRPAKAAAETRFRQEQGVGVSPRLALRAGDRLRGRAIAPLPGVPPFSTTLGRFRW